MNENLIANYIESKRGSWSEATANSEKYRLRGLTEELLMDGSKLFAYLKDERKLAAYSVKTTYTRAIEFADYLLAEGKLASSNLRAFRKANGNLFKFAYVKKAVGMTFDEAAKRIEGIDDSAAKEKARQLLYTGMRFSESLTLDESFQVTGKGGLQREVAMAKELPVTEFDMSYTKFYRILKAVGLTPHVLRKLCATKLVELGAQEADLMQRMGWRSSAMASIYVQAGRNKSLNEGLLAQLKKPKQENDDAK